MKDRILVLAGIPDLDYSEKYLALTTSFEYKSLKTLWEEQSEEYWKSIMQVGDFEELQWLKTRKRALKKLWRTLYAEDQQKEVSEAPEPSEV